jgi:NAD+-dependent farnesol dehydrogenase
MKIFITGATGYIGQKLVTRLINEGHHIHALCRAKPDGKLFENKRIRIFEGNLLNHTVLDEAMVGCDQVYHMAAYARVWARNPKTFFDINVKGTVNVLETAVKHGIKKVVVTSTGGTYGPSNGKPNTEDSLRTVDFYNEYESSKFIAEEKVNQYVCRGLDAVIVHPTRVYGPGVWTESNAISGLIRRYVSGEWHIIPGDGNSMGCFSYIDDVVTGHMLAMEKGKAGEKYILGGENLSFNTFFSLLERKSEKKYLLIKVPMPLMMVYGWQEEMMANVFGRTPLVTTKWIKKYNLDFSFSSEKAVRELGYKITPFEQGLNTTLSWLRQECNILF